MKKSIVCILLAVCVLLGLAACGQNSDTGSQTSEQTSASDNNAQKNEAPEKLS